MKNSAGAEAGTARTMPAGPSGTSRSAGPARTVAGRLGPMRRSMRLRRRRCRTGRRRRGRTMEGGRPFREESAVGVARIPTPVVVPAVTVPTAFAVVFANVLTRLRF